jgi:hypothetical protein
MRLYAPSNDNSEEYLHTHHRLYSIPLFGVICGEEIFLENETRWKEPVNAHSIIDPTFDERLLAAVPSFSLALSTVKVTAHISQEVHISSRFTVPTEDYLLRVDNLFQEHTNRYFSEVLDAMSVTDVNKVLFRHVQYDGIVSTKGKNKSSTIEKIKLSCREFNKVTKSKLVERENITVNQLLNRNFVSVQQEQEEVTGRIGSFIVRASTFNQFTPETPLGKSATDILLELFSIRDRAILSAHASQNNKPQNNNVQNNNRQNRVPVYVPRKPSYFFKSELIDSLFRNVSYERLKNNYIPPDYNIANSHQLFFLFKASPDDWKLIVVKVATGQVFYVDPLDNPQRNENYNNDLMHICCNNIKRFVNYLLLPTIVDWNASCHYPYQYQELYVPNNYDGVVVIMFFVPCCI